MNGFSHIKCYEYCPTARALQNAKHATWQYNKEHSKFMHVYNYSTTVIVVMVGSNGYCGNYSAISDCLGVECLNYSFVRLSSMFMSVVLETN